MKKTNLETDAPTSEEASPPPSSLPVTAQMIPLDKIFPSPTNPRKHWPAEAQAELEASMRSIGFTISTLLVRPEQASYFIDHVNADADGTGGQFFVMKQTGLAPLQGIVETVELSPTKEAAEALLAKLQGRYELVAGERRWRAAKAVRIAEAPCIVQMLTDREVLEIQLIENAQRKDLTVMEEAVGYGRLLDLRDEKGELVYTAKTLAVKIGKDIRTVERLRKLRVLAEDDALSEFREALEANVVTARHAILVTGIPDAKLRAKFAHEILHSKHYPTPLTIQLAEQLRQKDFMKDLRNADFDTKDAELLPVETTADLFQNRLRGGACTDCPFRAGNAVALFEGELPSGMHNMCMNPSCFAAKSDVGWKKWQEAETDPVRRRRALGEAECKKLYRYGDQLEWNSPYIDLADKPDSSDLKAGEEAPGTWRSMLKGIEIEVLVVKDRNGRKHELVDRGLARAGIEKAAKDSGGKSVLKPESKSGNGTSGGSGGSYHRAETPEERAARVLKYQRADEINDAARNAVAAVCAEKGSTGKPLPAGFWVELLEIWMEDFSSETPDELEARRGWKPMSLVSEMRKLEPHHQAGVVVEFLFLQAAANGMASGVLKLFGVDAKKIEKDTETALKAEHKKRDAVLEEIAKLAGVATLKDKDLDGIAKALWKKSYAELRGSHELEAVRDEIVKRSKAPLPVGTTAAKAAAKAANNSPAADGKMTPESRAKLAAAMKARWAAKAAKPAKKKATK